MPYIIQGRRDSLREETDQFLNNAGELNYAISQLLIQYILAHRLSYSTINDCLGALEGAKQEFYRRVAVPYEEKKIAENGDLGWPK